MKAISPQVLDEARRAFRVADTDGSGSLERKEVPKLLADVCGRLVSPAEAETFMHAMDRDGDGQVTEDEFLRGIAGQTTLPFPPEHDAKELLGGEAVAAVLAFMRASEFADIGTPATPASLATNGLEPGPARGILQPALPLASTLRTDDLGLGAWLGCPRRGGQDASDAQDDVWLFPHDAAASPV
jgi:hypothetical protein